MRPILNKVLVERIPGERTTASGIVLRTSEEPDKARIIGIGPDVTEVSVGEVALINWNAASKVGSEQYILTPDNIILIFEEENV